MINGPRQVDLYPCAEGPASYRRVPRCRVLHGAEVRHRPVTARPAHRPGPRRGRAGPVPSGKAADPSGQRRGELPGGSGRLLACRVTDEPDPDAARRARHVAPAWPVNLIQGGGSVPGRPVQPPGCRGRGVADGAVGAPGLQDVISAAITAQPWGLAGSAMSRYTDRATQATASQLPPHTGPRPLSNCWHSKLPTPGQRCESGTRTW